MNKKLFLQFVYYKKKNANMLFFVFIRVLRIQFEPSPNLALEGTPEGYSTSFQNKSEQKNYFLYINLCKNYNSLKCIEYLNF